jgi:hypothetical protein
VNSGKCRSSIQGLKGQSDSELSYDGFYIEICNLTDWSLNSSLAWFVLIKSALNRPWQPRPIVKLDCSNLNNEKLRSPGGSSSSVIPIRPK